MLNNPDNIPPGSPRLMVASAIARPPRRPVDPTTEMIVAQSGMMRMFFFKLVLEVGCGVAFMLPDLFVVGYGLAYLAVCIATAHFAYRLAKAMRGTTDGVAHAFLAILPCAGFLSVLMLNGQAIDRLRKLGIQVPYGGLSFPHWDGVHSPEPTQSRDELADKNERIEANLQRR
jgi:hypothetical protein